MTVEIVPFGFEAELLDAFWAVQDTLYADDRWWGILPLADRRYQFNPEASFFTVQGGTHRNFLARQDGRWVGRITAMVGPHLRHDDDGPLGLVGFFEAAPEPAEVGPALLEAALAWLREQGAERVRGPINFSTWYDYRFVVEGQEQGPFLLEPYHLPHYAGVFQAAGFEVYKDYASLLVPLVPVGLMKGAHARAEREGVRFEIMRADELPDQLPMFHRLGQIFSSKTAFTDLSFEEYQLLYGGAGALLTEPTLSWLAYSRDDEPLGYVFAYPDLLEPVRRGAPDDRPRHTVLKTIAASPDGPAGLGWALTYLHVKHALDAGYTHMMFALMEKYHELDRYAKRVRDGVEIIDRRYHLYERAL
jgi:hypothetical protein